MRYYISNFYGERAMKKNRGNILVLADRAMREAVRGVIAERKLRGQPLIIWRDGKVVKIPASQLNKI